MSNFLVWSDLHTEFEDFDIPIPGCQHGSNLDAPAREEVDAILLPGDLATRGRHVDLLLRIWDIWRVPVLAVAGNHEPYGAESYQSFIATEQERITQLRQLGADIDVLRRKERIIGDTRVLGATLWTDFELYPELMPAAIERASRCMPDYSDIKWQDRPGASVRKMTARDVISEHRSDLSFLLRAMTNPFHGDTLVMSHHPPVIEVGDPWRIKTRDPLNAAFASDLWPVLKNLPFNNWVYGHNHEMRDRELEGKYGPVNFVSNQRGYPFEDTKFDPLRLFRTVSAPDPVETSEPSLH